MDVIELYARLNASRVMPLQAGILCALLHILLPALLGKLLHSDMTIATAIVNPSGNLQ